MRCDRFSRLFSLLVIALFLFSFVVVAEDAADTGAGATGATGNTGGTGATGVRATGTGAGATGNEAASNTGTAADAGETPARNVVAAKSGFDEQKSYDWLKNKSASQIGPVLDQALVILALNNKGINVQSNVDVLKTFQDATTGCFPKSACKVKETALGLLALQSVGQDYSKSKDYLLKGTSALTPGLKQGEWRLQLDLAGSGTCKVSYGVENKSKTFTIENGTIKNTAGKYYIDVSRELDSSLISGKVSQPISIDCKDLTGVASLVYFMRAGNSYFLLDSQSLSAGLADLKIINACFRAMAGSGGCDFESSLYATWALVEAGESLGVIGTLPYLESTAILAQQSDLNKAILVRILQRSGNANSYFDEQLVSSQKTGSWGRGDIYITSWALFALQKGNYGDAITSATGYLQKRNLADGSWNGNAKDTAMALIALHGGELAKGYVSSVGGTGALGSGVTADDVCAGLKVDGMGRTKCGSTLCKDRPECLCQNGQKDEGEEGPDCGGSCEIPCSEGEGETEQGSEPLAEDVKPPTTDTSDTTKTEKKGSSTLVWVIVIILILAVAGGGTIYYLKSQGKLDIITSMFKPKTKGMSFDDFKMQTQNKPAVQQKPQQARPVGKPGGFNLPPLKPAQPLKKPTQDDDLERSLKEAEKLLKSK